jgi:hypothetical protein
MDIQVMGVVVSMGVAVYEGVRAVSLSPDTVLPGHQGVIQGITR